MIVKGNDDLGKWWFREMVIWGNWFCKYCNDIVKLGKLIKGNIVLKKIIR
jgi:hypothetical protein